jgi:hypothetical protein
MGSSCVPAALLGINALHSQYSPELFSKSQNQRSMAFCWCILKECWQFIHVRPMILNTPIKDY